MVDLHPQSYRALWIGLPLLRGDTLHRLRGRPGNEPISVEVWQRIVDLEVE
jgi:hypothetical protein